MRPGSSRLTARTASHWAGVLVRHAERRRVDRGIVPGAESRSLGGAPAFRVHPGQQRELAELVGDVRLRLVPRLVLLVPRMRVELGNGRLGEHPPSGAFGPHPPDPANRLVREVGEGGPVASDLVPVDPGEPVEAPVAAVLALGPTAPEQVGRRRDAALDPAERLVVEVDLDRVMGQLGPGVSVRTEGERPELDVDDAVVPRALEPG